MRLCRPVAVIVVLASSAAFADRGAKTAEFVGGLAISHPVLPDSSPLATASRIGPTFGVGASYGVSNWLDLRCTALYETSEGLSQDGVSTMANGSVLTGTMSASHHRLTGSCGPQLVFGPVWRLAVGAEAGFSREAFVGLQHVDANGRQFDEALPDEIRVSAVFAPHLELEWITDRSRVSFGPRFEALLGADTHSWAVLFPLRIGFTWY